MLTGWSGTSYGSSVTTNFAYDGDHLIAELDASGNVLRTYQWGLGAGGKVGALLSVTDNTNPSSPVTYTTVFDASGNLINLLDSAGGVAASYVYSAFGKLLSATGPAKDVCPIGWQTMYRDAVTGLSFADLRVYSPTLGRWMTPDPIAERGGANIYAYCGNDPINKSDPMGTESTAPKYNSCHRMLWEADNRPVVNDPKMLVSEPNWDINVKAPSVASNYTYNDILILRSESYSRSAYYWNRLKTPGWWSPEGLKAEGEAQLYWWKVYQKWDEAIQPITEFLDFLEHHPDAQYGSWESDQSVGNGKEWRPEGLVTSDVTINKPYGLQLIDKSNAALGNGNSSEALPYHPSRGSGYIPIYKTLDAQREIANKDIHPRTDMIRVEGVGNPDLGAGARGGKLVVERLTAVIAESGAPGKFTLRLWTLPDGRAGFFLVGEPQGADGYVFVKDRLLRWHGLKIKDVK